MSTLQVLADRLLQIGEAEDPGALARLVARLRQDSNHDRLLLALSGHPLADDPIVRALCGPSPDSYLELPDLLQELDDWTAFTQESESLEPDLMLSPHSSLSPLRRGWLNVLNTRGIRTCGADPDSTETLVLLQGTHWIHLDDPTQRWRAGRASLADILRLVLD
jgi:hypothetical protein